MKWVEKFEPYQHQVDEVGNIVQLHGGVVPKACQKCKTEFKSKTISSPIIQQVPFYVCQDCDLKTARGETALDHKLEYSNHTIKKSNKERITGYDNTIEGVISYITKTDDDAIILCGNCNGK